MASEYFTVGQVARERRISESKVLGWVRTGELAAVNVAQRIDGQRPRWRISREALELFDETRTSRPSAKPYRNRRAVSAGIVEFFK